MRNPIKILITGAGGAGTIEIIKSLKKIGGYHIIACDANPNAYGLRIADTRYIIPMGGMGEFLPEMKAILRQENPDYIIPLVDEEIMKFWETKTDAKILTPSAIFCAITLDKYGTHLELKKYGLPTPRTILANGISSIGPVVIKPRHGHGSKYLKYFGDDKSINEIRIRNAGKGENWVIQERIFGAEYTVSVVVSLDNKLFAVIPKEVIDKRGITMIGITRENKKIESLCEQIVEKMNPSGPFNVQLMMDKNGQPWIFEINPRYSTTIALTIAAGINEVDAVIKAAENREQKVLGFIPNLVMNRYYTQDYYTI